MKIKWIPLLIGLAIFLIPDPIPLSTPFALGLIAWSLGFKW